jgi:hypothetical protein
MMREAEFDAWLKNDYAGRNGVGLGERDRASRLSSARRIEQYEGDLDAHFVRDGMARLLERFAYAFGESVRGQTPRHSIPLDGNLYKLTAHYRHIAHLYLGFRQQAGWQAALQARGINAADYLWNDSATAFPGVRRYAGKAELRHFQQNHGMDVEGVLRLDDNNYPKQLWSFTLRGRPFQNFGPDGYELAHLVDHKAYKHRGAEELVGPVGEFIGANGLPGLFTSAANAAYVPTYLRPTDFSGMLRNLLQRRALELYGSFCRLLPGDLRFRPASSPAWETSAFTWSAPVGTTDHLTAFLDFRRTELQRLFDERQPSV